MNARRANRIPPAQTEAESSDPLAIRFFWISPVIPWTLMTATILESVLLEYRLQKAALLADVAAPPVRDASARAGEVPTADN